MNKILLFIDKNMSLTDDVNNSLFTILDDSIYYTSSLGNDPTKLSQIRLSLAGGFDIEWFRMNLFPDKKFTNAYNKYKELKVKQNLDKRIKKLNKI